MANATPEDMQKGMEPWVAYFTRVGDAMVDKGAPLGESMHFGKNEHPKGEAQVSGYSIMQAENAEALKGLLEGHPHLSDEGTCIEALEMLSMPGM